MARLGTLRWPGSPRRRSAADGGRPSRRSTATPPPDRPEGRRATRLVLRSEASELRARIVTAIPALIVAIALIIQGGVLFTLGVLLLGALCMHELFALYQGTHPVRLAGFIALVGLLFTAEYGTELHLVLATIASVPLLFGAALLQRETSVAGIAITLLGIIWIGLALAHGILLRRLPHGEDIVFDVLIGTFVGDTGAYLGGRAFGRRLLAPRISPHKTWEGLLCGIAAGTLAVWFWGGSQSFMPGGHALLLGLGIATVAPIGDLFESYVKRDAGVKDSGRVFGPHGGALDRLDAILFTAVMGFYIWWAYM